MELQPQNTAPEVWLLVEGKDVEAFFKALCRHHLSSSEQPKIMDFKGVNELKKFLLGLRGHSDFQAVKRIGIIRDAEKMGEDSAFRSIRASLEHAKLAVPEKLEQPSCDGQPSVSVLILPGQGESGMLETLLCKTFKNTPEHDCIDAFFSCVEEKRPNLKISRPDKARARVFLATKEKPYSSVGVAAKEGYWNLDHEALEPARRFLKSVRLQNQPIVKEPSRKPKPVPLTKETLLVVEGKDQLKFFEVLRDYLSSSEKLELSEKLEIRHFKYVDEFDSFLTALCGSRGFKDVKSIGIIRDAGTGKNAAVEAFQSVKASLEKAKLAVPEKPEQFFSCDGQPSIGVLILPGQGKPGMLETLLCETFADGPEQRCIDAFFRCVKENCPDSNISSLDKARARVFLATKQYPHPSVGIAAKKKYWNLDHEVLKPVCRFLQSIAGTATAQ